MKKAKIYIPSKTAMQSGKSKQKYWILEFDTKDSKINPLMGWESSTDTLGEVVLKFSSKEKAIEYANLNSISYKLLNPNKKEFVLKSYADNFLKKLIMWRSYFNDKKWFYWSYGGGFFILLLLVTQTYLDVLFNSWYKDFY